MSPTFNKRQMAILNQVRQDGRVLVERLAEAFGTTPQTIRRDLNILEDTGEIMRFHGGASLLPGVEYTDFDVRQAIAIREKETIAKVAAKRIPENTLIMLNGGTTTMALAGELGGHIGLKIIVDNVNIANFLRTFPGIEALVPGGAIRRSDGAVTGESVLEFIRGFRADIAVVGAAAIDSGGTLLDFDRDEAAVTRTMMVHAKHTIVVADSSKFGRSAPVVIGHLSSTDTLITESCANAKIRQLCKAGGVELVEASV